MLEDMRPMNLRFKNCTKLTMGMTAGDRQSVPPLKKVPKMSFWRLLRVRVKGNHDALLRAGRPSGEVSEMVCPIQIGQEMPVL